MTIGVAILDANVLYPAALRDLLLQLAYAGLFIAHWSADIDDEWKRNLLADRPELAAHLPFTHAKMLQAIPGALVTGYEKHIPGLLLPDPGDRHVVAAAITAEANVIVTYNLKDFPSAAIAPYGLQAMHPDAFFQSIIVAAPRDFLQGVHDCVARLTNPRVSSEAYLKKMVVLGLPETAAFLRANLEYWRT